MRLTSFHPVEEGTERESFERWIDETSDRAYRLAYDFVRNHEDALDCVQESYLKAFRSRGGFQQRSQFGTWFHRIVYNTCIDFIRKRARRGRRMTYSSTGEENSTHEMMDLLGDKRVSASPESDLIRGEIAEDVHKALEYLSKKQRTVFILKHYHGYTLEEIADILVISIGTAKSHLFRAVQGLRKRLRHEDILP